MKIILAGLLVFLIAALIAAQPKSAAAAGISIGIPSDAPKDPYGHLERNSDGTYYRGDRIQVNYGAVGNFGGPVRVSADASSDSYVVADRPAGALMLRPLPTISYGMHNVTITVTASKENGDLAARDSKTFTFNVVPFQPKYQTYFWPVLKDAGRFTLDDRTGVAVKYLGSIGQDGKLYEGRRAILLQNHDSNSTGLALTTNGFFPLNVPMPDGSVKQAPNSIDFVYEPHILKVESDNATPLYFNSTGMQHYYLKTTAINATAVSLALNATIVTHYYWPQQNFTSGTINYTIPAHREPFANSLFATIKTNNDTQASYAFKFEPKAENVTATKRFMTLQDFGLAKALYDTNDVKIAGIVRADMPSGDPMYVDNKSASGGFQAVKSDILLSQPELEMGSLDRQEPITLGDFLTADWNAILTGAQSPMILTATSPEGETLKKVIPDYDFSHFIEEIIIDVRHTNDLKVLQNFGHIESSIEAPWEIHRISFEPKDELRSLGCHDNRCDIYTGAARLTSNHTIIAFNEYGGSAAGILLPETDQNLADSGFFGVTSKIDNSQFVFWLGLTGFLFFMIFFAKSTLKYFAERVNL